MKESRQPVERQSEILSLYDADMTIKETQSVFSSLGNGAFASFPTISLLNLLLS